MLGKDESTDLALLQVDPAGAHLTPLTLGSSKGVQVGDPAIAIGNPFGLERTLTTGVISAVQRTIQAPNNFEIDDVLQTDAPINPGNSGGPLIDATGKVIGINSQIATGGSGSQGSVGHRLRRADRHRQADHSRTSSSPGASTAATWGSSSLTVDKTLKDLNLPVDHGALVQSVTPGGPADKAGIHAGNLSATLDNHPIQLGGDIIIKVAGKDIRSEQRSAGGRRGPQVGRQGQGHAGARGQGQDRRGHARRASEHGDQPALTYDGGHVHGRPSHQALRNHLPRRRPARGRGGRLGGRVHPVAGLAAGLRSGGGRAHRRGACAGARRSAACSSTRRSTRSPAWSTASG